MHERVSEKFVQDVPAHLQPLKPLLHKLCREFETLESSQARFFRKIFTGQDFQARRGGW